MRTRGLVTVTAFAAGSYLSYVAKTWLGFGRGQHRDPLLDRFMPEFDVREHHSIKVAAPPSHALLAALELNLEKSRIVRAIFKGRELILGGEPPPKLNRPRGLVSMSLSIGWSILAETPDREIVLGAVTQPWIANPVFRTIPGDQFLPFDEPKYVKIIWTLKATPVNSSESLLSMETRALATDSFSRKRFRVYWAFLSPGIKLIRWVLLRGARQNLKSGQFKPVELSDLNSTGAAL